MSRILRIFSGIQICNKISKIPSRLEVSVLKNWKMNYICPAAFAH